MRFIDQQKTRVVLPVVFDACQQDASAILFGCLLRRDGRRIAQTFGDNVAHASRRVVKRHGLDVGAGTKEIPALVEGDRM